MKQKDFITIGFIVIISAAMSVILAKQIISTPKNRQQKVEQVDVISPEFNRPPSDSKVFNASAINPTQSIQIGTDVNNKPISGGQ